MVSGIRWLVGVIMLVAAASPAWADKRVALIVANAAYRNAPLANPLADAGLVAASLRKIGFDTSVVENADLAAFDRALGDFAERARSADIALFYFAGHGFAVSDGLRPVSVLMSTSADVTSASERVLRSGGIPLDDVVQSLSGRARATLIFVDACRNDPRVTRAAGGTGRGFARIETPDNASLFIGLSTRLGETASDGEDGAGSPFARAFAAGITVTGQRIDDVFRGLRDKVRTETSGRQVPDVVQDDLPQGAMVLVREEPSAVAVTQAPQPVANTGTPAGAVTGPVPATIAPDGSKLALSITPPPPPAGAGTITACDRLAGSATDLDKVAPGIEFRAIEPDKARPACEQATAADPQSRRLMFNYGRALDAAEDYAQALVWYRKAADAGSAAGMANIGRLYEDGTGVKKDIGEAVGWYRKSAVAGNSVGMNDLGAMYESGIGVRKDVREAMGWYRKAADAGNAIAMRNIGLLYRDGKGVKRDYGEAMTWYLKSVAAGDATAMTEIGWAHERGLGVPQDARKANDWYRKGALAGDGLGMNNLASSYAHGTGVERDTQQAVEWEIKALQASNDFAFGQMADKKAAAWPVEFRRAMQAELKARGLIDGPVTGRFDAATVDAIHRLANR